MKIKLMVMVTKLLKIINKISMIGEKTTIQIIKTQILEEKQPSVYLKTIFQR